MSQKRSICKARRPRLDAAVLCQERMSGEAALTLLIVYIAALYAYAHPPAPTMASLSSAPSKFFRLCRQLLMGYLE